MKRLLYSFLFHRIAGWKIEGDLPDIKKYLIIVAPHTSNWDFPIGLAVRSLRKFDAKYLAKKELFKFPFGKLFRSLGGYPVDRSKKTNLVDAVTEMFEQHDSFIVAMTPEGTRSYVPSWRSGFYHIALKAKVPIVMAAIDYPNKRVVFDKAFTPSGNREADMRRIAEFYFDKRGKVSKNWPDEFYTLTGHEKPLS